MTRRTRYPKHDAVEFIASGLMKKVGPSVFRDTRRFRRLMLACLREGKFGETAFLAFCRYGDKNGAGIRALWDSLIRKPGGSRLPTVEELSLDRGSPMVSLADILERGLP